MLWLGALVLVVAIAAGLSQAYFIGRLGSVDKKIDSAAEETRLGLAAIQGETRENFRTLSAALASAVQEKDRQPPVIVVPPAPQSPPSRPRYSLKPKACPPVPMKNHRVR